MAEEDEDQAARAFETLRAEVTVMRRVVEALEAKKPKDYAPTLGEITKQLEKLTIATATLAQRPAMQLTPETYAGRLNQATTEAARPVAGQLQRAENLTHRLEEALGRVRTREGQRTRVFQAAGVGAAVGAILLALLAPMIARALPDGWHVPERLAAGIVGADRWTAGQQMADSYGPEAWARIVRGAELEKANREALDACTSDATRTGRAQRCTIQVNPPTRPSPVSGAGA